MYVHFQRSPMKRFFCPYLGFRDRACTHATFERLELFSLFWPPLHSINGAMKLMYQGRLCSHTSRVRLIFLVSLTPSDCDFDSQVLPEDNSFNWGAVLLRLLPWEQTQRKDLVMSVLKALAYNPPLAVAAPKWQPKVCV